MGGAAPSPSWGDREKQRPRCPPFSFLGEGKWSEAAPLVPHFPFSPSLDGEKVPRKRRMRGTSGRRVDGAARFLVCRRASLRRAPHPPLRGTFSPLRGAKG